MSSHGDRLETGFELFIDIAAVLLAAGAALAIWWLVPGVVVAIVKLLLAVALACLVLVIVSWVLGFLALDAAAGVRRWLE